MNHSFTRILFFLCLLNLTAFSQNKNAESVVWGRDYPVELNTASHPCITPAEYRLIEKRCAENRALLKLDKIPLKNSSVVSLNWPLRTSNGVNDCSYYFIGNYVDQDTAAGTIRDYHCGSVTYDGHRGTDIVTYPYPFYKMDNNQVEVIAAAAGTIIDRADGNFDRNCAMNNSTANYIIIQHADGSCAFYWHMKMNTVTAKTIGQTVVAGEFLGVVGSSGSSTAPHLHLEVWQSTTMNTLRDAFAGPCNPLNANSWWAVQKPYTEPAIIEASVHPALAVFPTCPATETPNEDSCFQSGGSAKFYIFIRNETSGMTANMRIVNPNGSTFSSWTHNSNANRLSSYWISTQTLPTAAGTYTFEATYNGITCSKSFKINCSLLGISAPEEMIQLKVYPNPANSLLNITGEGIANGYCRIKIHNIIGQVVLNDYTIIENNAVHKILSVSEFPDGVYYLAVETEKLKVVRNFIIQNQ